MPSAISWFSTSDISNMIELYESRTNYVKVIKDLKLNLKFDLNDDESMLLKLQMEAKLYEKSSTKVLFNEDGYSLMDENSK